jgi:hypothetical protein
MHFTTRITVVLGGGQNIPSEGTLVTYSTPDAEWVTLPVFQQTLSSPPPPLQKATFVNLAILATPPESTSFQTILSFSILILISYSFLTFSLYSHLFSWGKLACFFIGQ